VREVQELKELQRQGISIQGITKLREFGPQPSKFNPFKPYSEGRQDRRMRVHLAPKALVVDEVGYLPLDDPETTFFVQLISAVV